MNTQSFLRSPVPLSFRADSSCDKARASRSQDASRVPKLHRGAMVSRAIPPGRARPVRFAHISSCGREVVFSFCRHSCARQSRGRARPLSSFHFRARGAALGPPTASLGPRSASPSLAGRARMFARATARVLEIALSRKSRAASATALAWVRARGARAAGPESNRLLPVLFVQSLRARSLRSRARGADLVSSLGLLSKSQAPVTPGPKQFVLARHRSSQDAVHYHPGNAGIHRPDQVKLRKTPFSLLQLENTASPWPQERSQQPRPGHDTR